MVHYAPVILVKLLTCLSLLSIYFRILSTSAILLAVLSLDGVAQESRLPAFDSFSYLSDPVFRVVPRRLAAKPQKPVDCVVPASVPEPESIPVIEVNECPGYALEPTLSEAEQFELQLALDKALSQILKLTVDYEVLRTRMQHLDSSTVNQQGLSQQGRGKLQELVDLHAKQLADRDEQLSLLQNRLEAVQGRYDSENTSRMLAEKQLKVALNKNKETEKSLSASEEKLNLLTLQLEKNKVIVQRLETDLQAQRSTRAKSSTKNLGSPYEPGQMAKKDKAATSFEISNEWVVDGLRFTPGSADIELDSTRNLDLLVQHLKQNPALSIQVNGYTDSIGSIDSNLRLSQARAESVADYLIEQGVKFYRIKALGYGERRSLGDNGTEQGRLLNRRVAVLFLK